MSKTNAPKTTALFALLALLLVSPITLAQDAQTQTGEKRFLRITAYYSPLPDQSYYIRGSYEADVRLNGRGTNGADGTPVFEGMLAAPKTYPFGTRIRIPGLGVGTVHDRGGAIVPSGQRGQSYDRLDIWMGHGEEGLSRALNWGSRVVEAEVFFDPNLVEPGLSYASVNSSLPASYVNNLEARTLANLSSASLVSASDKPVSPVTPEVQVPIIPIVQPKEEVIEVENAEIIRLEQNRLLLAAGLGKDAEGEDVLNLQRMLWDLGYYKGELHGKYDQATIEAVFGFQKDHDVVSQPSDLGAGYFGQKTLVALLEALEKKIQVLASYPQELQVWVPAKRDLPQIASLQAPEVSFEKQGIQFSDDLLNKKIVHPSTTLGMTNSFVQELDLDDKGEQVLLLQRFLISQGHLKEGFDTGYFGQTTQQAVLDFQIKQGIVTSTSDSGAGRVGPKTLERINSL